MSWTCCRNRATSTARCSSSVMGARLGLDASETGWELRGVLDATALTPAPRRRVRTWFGWGPGRLWGVAPEAEAAGAARRASVNLKEGNENVVEIALGDAGPGVALLEMGV